MRIRFARIGSALAFISVVTLAAVTGAGSAWAQEATATTTVTAPATATTTVTAPATATVTTTVTAPATATTTVTAPATATADVNVNVSPTGWDETDVTEKDGHKYYFLGARYRGYVIPKPFINIFVSGGAWVYSNSTGIELDIRKDGFSLIPNITYTEYSTGDMLFLQHGESESEVGNWSIVNSGLKVIYAGADFLWSVKLAKNLDFEYGMGFGLGVVFGNLEDNWVHTAAANATYVNASGQTVGAIPGSNVVSGNTSYFVPCTAVGPVGSGCNPADHQNATTPKVGGYDEPHGFNPVPTLFLNVSVPQFGLRIKPIKSFVARVNVGFNIPNGFWFGFSGDYGLEDALDKK
jgi:hypothetical protein